jgi:hypothetical protein
MRCARALPAYPLMLAAGSCKATVATCSVDDLTKTERPQPFDRPHAGHPILIMSPDLVRGPR